MCLKTQETIPCQISVSNSILFLHTLYSFMVVLRDEVSFAKYTDFWYTTNWCLYWCPSRTFDGRHEKTMRRGGEGIWCVQTESLTLYVLILHTSVIIWCARSKFLTYDYLYWCLSFVIYVRLTLCVPTVYVNDVLNEYLICLVYE